MRRRFVPYERSDEGLLRIPAEIYPLRTGDRMVEGGIRTGNPLDKLRAWLHYDWYLPLRCWCQLRLHDWRHG